MRHTFHAVATGVVFWFSAAGALGADAEIVFDPPKSVIIKQTNGLPARGDLLRIDREVVHLRALNGKEVQIKLDRVRSVKTSDETLEFWPDQETFDELARRIGTVSGARLIGTVTKPAKSGDSATPAEERDAAAQRRRDRVENDNVPRDADGRGPFGISVPTTNPPATEPAPVIRTDNARPAPADEPDPADGADDTAADSEAVPGTEILVCSNCMKDLPAGFASGDRCPHCNKVAVFDTGNADPFTATAAATPVGQNPFAASGAPAPVAAIPAAVAAPASAAPAAGTGGGGLADVPLYGKIGIFVAFLVAGWLIMQRR